ncbi:MAG: carbohydrate kinase family protein [Verrucomicrobiota bacterium]|nr:MAG: carbohydrate kinase family protein [Verrucomicrobiota bacterium]
MASALVGFDGFVDHIFQVVDQRHGTGQDFQKVRSISAFAQRITRAAGKSTNIELYPIETRIGGNGPILANALATYGLHVDLIGTLDHPIFQTLSSKIQQYSLGVPGITNALEFDDGKLLLGVTQPMDAVTRSCVFEILPPLTHDLFCFTNWTMIVQMNDIIQKLLPQLPQNALCFFDLADPEKRFPKDLLQLFEIAPHPHMILGLNRKEAEHILSILHKNTDAELTVMASTIQKHLPFQEVFIHDTRSCAASNGEMDAFIDGITENFYVESPKTTTGAGDHFNAGYLTARLQEQSLIKALHRGFQISSHFVRTGECLSPSE